MSKEKEKRMVRIIVAGCPAIDNTIGKVISEHPQDTCIAPTLRVVLIKKKLQDEHGYYETILNPQPSVLIIFPNDEQTFVSYAGIRYEAIVKEYIKKPQPELATKPIAQRGVPQR